jgi:DNA invertase Pin-like site-specific DNA recombinase
LRSNFVATHFDEAENPAQQPGNPGNVGFHIFGALGQFERDLIRERTRAGLAAASRAAGEVGANQSSRRKSFAGPAR